MQKISVRTVIKTVEGVLHLQQIAKNATMVFLGLCTLGVAHAQSVELELFRTSNVPGFVRVDIYPDSDMNPIPLQNVFVQRYTDEEAPYYENILPLIRELGGEVLAYETYLSHTTQDLQNRYIFLGGDDKDPSELSFDVTTTENPLEAFEAFIQQNLKPVYLRNVSIECGGNITDIYPKKVDVLTQDGIAFIAKFERPLRTRITIRAMTPLAEIVANTALDLNDEIYVYEGADYDLPEMWEAYNTPLTNDTPSHGRLWINIFPWILATLGIMILAWYVLTILENSKAPQRSLPLTYDKKGSQRIRQEMESLPPFPEKKKEPQAPENVPFELEDQDINPPL